ncbi:MAG: flagellar basal-body rod protein FlgG [Bacteroidetes bacterium]|nr:flagellar basal-body rod protein FlgG [Rhodothermia bacterium]MCS7156068.1 flagellar basal-body rod protein FlgG [Bacteroidota bacterium]MCX7907756.1 flagellar basal-body rod protein FlgG [Bacteroidota bacterium]MDW8137885.1 flagellar basal-body rod protein FlgG [Bacteroidota bacterium]MDW8286264.1 flagellar basal-body rod protein FlgG [Bacteroidota bacterium]
MIRALYTAALGMRAQQMGVDVIAHNLANANTTAFKRTRVEFQDLFYQRVPVVPEARNERTPPAELELGHGVQAVATARNFVQGSLIETGNALDLAIQGEGFFQIERPDGTIVYTRDGSFTLNEQGEILTSTGLPLVGRFVIPPEAASVVIGSDGTILVTLHGQSQPVQVGQIELARFINPEGLRPIGGNLYEATPASGEPILGVPNADGMGAIKQGFLEQSNVDVVQEMVNLIVAQRAYEINTKMVQTTDELWSMTNNMKR